MSGAVYEMGYGFELRGELDVFYLHGYSALSYVRCSALGREYLCVSMGGICC